MRNNFILAFLAGLTVFVGLTAHPACAETEGIGWIPTWKQAIVEASKAHKPILLIAAAPQCAGVSGLW